MQISSHRDNQQSQQESRNPRSGRKLTARCPDNVNVVRDSVRNSLKSPFKDVPKIFGLSHASLHRMLKKDLQLYPYRIQIKNKLTPADMEFLVSAINHYHINWLHLF